MAETEIEGTQILPILERADETTQRQVDTQEELAQTLKSLVKVLQGFQSGGVSGQRRSQSPSPSANKNPIQPQNPSTLNNVFSFIGEKKDKAVEFIKKGFFKLFKTDYFGNLLKSVGALAKAIGNALFGWLKFFIMMAFIDPSGGFLRDIINLFAEIGMIVFKTVMPLIPVAIKMMFDTIVYVFKLILRLIPSIITIIMQTFTQLGNNFPILKPIIGFINQFLSAIRSLFIVFNDPKADKGQGFKTFLKKVFVILVDLVVWAVKLILKYLPLIIDNIIVFIKKDLIPGLLKLIPEFLDSIVQGIDEIIKAYPELDAWLSPIKKFINVISNFIKKISSSESTIDFSFITKSIDLLKNILIVVKDVFIDIVKTIWDALGGEEGISAIFSDISETFSAIFTRLADFFNNTIKPVVEMAMPIIKRVVTFLVQGLVWGFKLFLKILPYVIDLLLLLPKIIWKYLFPIFLKLIDIFMDMVDAVKIVYNWIAQFSIKVYKYFSELIDNVINLFSSWYDKVVKFKDDISNFLSDLGKAISDWWEKLEILEPLKNIGLMILGFLGSLAIGFYDEFIKPIGDMFSDFWGFIKSIKLPSWLGGSSESNESKASTPYNQYADPMFIKKQQEMALLNKKKEQEFLNLPKNQKKLLDLKYDAERKNGVYDKLAENTNKGITESLKNGVKIDKINFDTTEVKAPSGMFTNVFKDVKFDTKSFGFDDFMFSIKKSLSQIGNWFSDKLYIFTLGKLGNKTVSEKIFDIANVDNIQQEEILNEFKKDFKSKLGHWDMFYVNKDLKKAFEEGDITKFNDITKDRPNDDFIQLLKKLMTSVENTRQPTTNPIMYIHQYKHSVTTNTKKSGTGQ